MIQHISIERIEQIDKEREQTMSIPEFKQWLQDLNVGRMVPKHIEGRQRANEMMKMIEENRENTLHSNWPLWVRAMY